MPASPPARKKRSPARLSPAGTFARLVRCDLQGQYDPGAPRDPQAQCDPGARCGCGIPYSRQPCGIRAAGTPPFGRPCREQCGQAEQQGTHCRMQRRLPDPQQVERKHHQRNRKHRNNRKNPFPIHSNILFINIGIDIAPAFIDPTIYCVSNQAIREQRRPQPPSP